MSPAAVAIMIFVVFVAAEAAKARGRKLAIRAIAAKEQGIMDDLEIEQLLLAQRHRKEQS